MTQGNGKLVVIALGGNALLQKDDERTIDAQKKNAKTACSEIVKLIEMGYNVQIVHGNGPQAGDILLQNIDALKGSNKIPASPLDVIVAETQGEIGFIIEEQLTNILNEKKIDQNVATVITRVVVDKSSPAFQNPTKPIGPFYSEEESKRLTDEGYIMREQTGKGWRINTYSPKPVDILEYSVIKLLAETKKVVTISCGGGGIPVYKDEKGNYYGIGGVIDKDSAASLLATMLKADLFMILTDIDSCRINFCTPKETKIGHVSVDEIEKLLPAFGVGSMKPKVEACIDFTKKTGSKSIITSINCVVEALREEKGTIILPNKN